MEKRYYKSAGIAEILRGDDRDRLIEMNEHMTMKHMHNITFFPLGYIRAAFKRMDVKANRKTAFINGKRNAKRRDAGFGANNVSQYDHCNW